VTAGIKRGDGVVVAAEECATLTSASSGQRPVGIGAIAAWPGMNERTSRPSRRRRDGVAQLRTDTL